jgi:hypothetical protein
MLLCSKIFTQNNVLFQPRGKDWVHKTSFLLYDIYRSNVKVVYTKYIYPCFFGGIRVANLSSFLCCPMMCYIFGVKQQSLIHSISPVLKESYGSAGAV